MNRMRTTLRGVLEQMQWIRENHPGALLRVTVEALGRSYLKEQKVFTEKELRVKSGYMYLNARYFEGTDNIYAYVPNRIWWKPWRWSVRRVLLLEEVPTKGAEDAPSEYLLHDASKAQVLGMFKLLEVK